MVELCCEVKRVTAKLSLIKVYCTATMPTTVHWGNLFSTMNQNRCSGCSEWLTNWDRLTEDLDTIWEDPTFLYNLYVQSGLQPGKMHCYGKRLYQQHLLTWCMWTCDNVDTCQCVIVHDCVRLQSNIHLMLLYFCPSLHFAGAGYNRSSFYFHKLCRRPSSLTATLAETFLWGRLICCCHGIDPAISAELKNED